VSQEFVGAPDADSQHLVRLVRERRTLLRFLEPAICRSVVDMRTETPSPAGNFSSEASRFSDVLYRTKAIGIGRH
jgi:hypothetical protein